MSSSCLGMTSFQGTGSFGFPLQSSDVKVKTTSGKFRARSRTIVPIQECPNNSLPGVRIKVCMVRKNRKSIAPYI